MNMVQIARNLDKVSHVVILGAGASMAAIPMGDKYGNKTSVMSGFLEKLDMQEVIRGLNLKTKSDNLEDIYSELANDNKYDDIRNKLELKIYDYFSALTIPDEPTVYDYLILSLTSKDLIATFNWDSLLLQAYQRVSKITINLPQLTFLHGNVGIGSCNEHKIMGPIGNRCKECEKQLTASKLLYPVKEKNYVDDPLLWGNWTTTQRYIENSFMVTIFGYSAPKTDKGAIDLLKLAWGDLDERSNEEFSIIDVIDEDEAYDRWENFIHTHHFDYNNSFFDSYLGRFPRRTCEAVWGMLFETIPADGEKGFKNWKTFEEIEEFLRPLLKEEECYKGKRLPMYYR